jgi:HPt (histidine-containing phosphotransfer) domain-containing protein
MQTTAPAPNQLALLDPKQLDVLVLFGNSAYHELIADVVADVPTHLSGIRAALEDRSSTELRAKAHSCRGMLSNFGCIGMTARLARFEHESLPPPTEAATIHAELETLWQRTLTAIRGWETTVPEFT